MSTRKQLFLLLTVLLGGISLLAVVSAGAVLLIRRETMHLSRETSPTQIKLAELQQGFEDVSNSFFRISAASTQSELSRVDSELGRAVSEVQSIAKELALSATFDNAAIQNIGDSGDELRQMSHERIEGRQKITEADRSVAAKVEGAEESVRNLSSAMARLEKSGQMALVSSRQANLDANAALKTLLGERNKIDQLRTAFDEPARDITAELDTLELAVSKSNAGISPASDLIGYAAMILVTSAEVQARGQAIQALVGQLESASDAASVDRVAAEIAHQSDEVNRGLSSILERAPDRAPARASAGAAQKSFAGVRELLIGPRSIASTVREGLDKQHQAEQLLENSIQAIRKVAIDESNRAHNAAGAQQQAMARIQALSVGTLFAVGTVTLALLVLGSAKGRKLGQNILSMERRRLNSAHEMRKLIERVRAGAHALRETSRTLVNTSERITRDVETVVNGTSQMETSIRSVATQASEASQVSGGAAGLVASASAAVSGLHQASVEIAKVTGMIRSIAFETNLLALNAAIEAAHAGKFGAGFGVVASEVKKLAEAAGASTSEIDARIRAMNDQVESVTGAMAGVTSIIAQIREMQDAIAAGVQEQTTTTGQIAASISATATGFRGTSSKHGIHAMALQLSGLAEDLDALCQTR